MSSTLPPLTRRLIPRFTSAARKGDHGRVVVVGGAGEYTGAPFYAAATALKTGADLAVVVCSAEAVVPIRVHGGGELIVHGLLGAPADSASDARLASVLERAGAVVVGPGLSRGESALATAAAVIDWTRTHGVPTVVDGDALWLAAQRPALVHAHGSALLTPNAGEYKRLWFAAGGGGETPGDAAALSALLGGVAILRKGAQDEVAACGAGGGGSSCSWRSDGTGSPRRCGGQGDVLAGAAATFLAWASRGGWLAGRDGVSRPDVLVAAAAGASLLTRAAAAAAFGDCARATTTPDVIARVGRAFDACFPQTLWDEGAERPPNA